MDELQRLLADVDPKGLRPAHYLVTEAQLKELYESAFGEGQDNPVDVDGTWHTSGGCTDISCNCYANGFVDGEDY